MATRKRAGDDAPASSTKRAKGEPSFLPPKGDLNDIAGSGRPGSSASSSQSEEITRKRAEIAAKFAAMKKAPAGFATAALRPLTLPKAPLPSAPSLPSFPAPNAIGNGLDAESMSKRVAEARKRVMDLAARAKNPYLQEQATSSNAGAAGLHPLLLAQASTGAQTKKERYKPMVPKFATVKANAKAGPQLVATPRPDYISASTAADAAEDQRNNPYFDKKLAAVVADSAKDRDKKKLKFNQKGKFIQLGEAARQEARLEDLKKRIAESSRKAGLEDEMATVEKQIRRAPPPDVEWWDEDYLPTKSYVDVSNGSASAKIRAADSPITIYVQHPIQLPAPGDKFSVEFASLKLTKKEMKKMRRQRRKATFQDKHDRQRMGLLPPDPPKVKLSNMMKVLTSDAVADPTKIEARVRREMLQRRKVHEKNNEERKLTDDQRREKSDKKKEEDEAKGIHSCVFRIRYLTNPAHKFKVRKNAEQLGLTGVTIFNPKFSLVVIEGGFKAVKAYKHLMMNRINWTEEARIRVSETGEDDETNQGIGDEKEGGIGEIVGVVNGQGGEGEVQPNLAENKCEIIWQGECREHAFKKFRPRACPTDQTAKEFLGSRMEGFWDVAKKWTEAHADQ